MSLQKDSILGMNFTHTTRMEFGNLLQSTLFHKLRISYFELKKAANSIINFVENQNCYEFELTTYWSWGDSYNHHATEAFVIGRFETLKTVPLVACFNWIQLIYLTKINLLQNRKNTGFFCSFVPLFWATWMTVSGRSKFLVQRHRPSGGHQPYILQIFQEKPN